MQQALRMEKQMKRRYKAWNHDHGPFYFDSEKGMQQRVMMLLLSGTDVNVYDRLEQKFVRMTDGMKALRKLYQRDDNVH